VCVAYRQNKSPAPSSQVHKLRRKCRQARIRGFSADWGQDYLKNNRVVFNLCGNKYRIVVLVDYARYGMLIRFVGTHEEYDKIEDIEHI